jgi:aspartate carbamoyltransferase regulatory subunit
MTKDSKLKVYALERGTVIDHIPSPLAMKVVEILGVQHEGILTIGINFPSRRPPSISSKTPR